jgi:hypothetical protein
MLSSSSLAAFSTAVFPPNFQRSAGLHHQTLRTSLLEEYDARSIPTSNRSNNFSAAGTDVRMQLRIFKVQNVNLAEGSMRLKAWLRMYWSDERLSWDAAKFGGLTSTYLYGDDSIGLARRFR